MVLQDLHLHTSYTDGQDRPEEMINTAISLGLGEIAFTEHYNENSLKWFDSYVNEIMEMKEKYRSRIQIDLGVETKILDTNGSVLLPEKYIDCVEIVIASFHGIPEDKCGKLKPTTSGGEKDKYFLWLEAIKGVLKNPRVNVLGHLQAINKNTVIEMPPGSFEAVADLIARSGKAVECNIRYEVPKMEFINQIISLGGKITIGTDSHSAREMSFFWKKSYYLTLRNVIGQRKDVFYEPCRRDSVL